MTTHAPCVLLTPATRVMDRRSRRAPSVRDNADSAGATRRCARFHRAARRDRAGPAAASRIVGRAPAATIARPRRRFAELMREDAGIDQGVDLARPPLTADCWRVCVGLTQPPRLDQQALEPTCSCTGSSGLSCDRPNQLTLRRRDVAGSSVPRSPAARGRCLPRTGSTRARRLQAPGHFPLLTRPQTRSAT